MITINQHPCDAFYAVGIDDKTKGKPKVTYLRRKVVAWNEDGIPLVIGKYSLVPAEEFDGFRGIDVDILGNIIGAIPGGGYKAKYKDADGSFFELPILAWIIKEETAIPLVVNADGTDFNAFSKDFDSIIPPEQFTV